MTQNPFILIARALKLWLSGRVQFEKGLDGEQIEVAGEIFEPFRKVVVKPRPAQPQRSGAIFCVRFRFKSFSSAANRRLSWIPIPLIVAQPGFRSKSWLLGRQTGDFMGVYEFDTTKQAEAYWNSLPLRMMRRRAQPGTLSYEVQDNASGRPETRCRVAPGTPAGVVSSNPVRSSRVRSNP